MKKIAIMDFPNPVLFPDSFDYSSDCSFRLTIGEVIIEEDANGNICIPVKYLLQCNVLKEAILCGDAEVIVRIKSIHASFLRCFPFPEGKTEFLIKIPKFDIIHNVEIDGIIVAKKKILDYEAPGEWNDEIFDGQTFTIEKGSFLAYYTTIKLYLDASELEKPIKSLFRYRYNPELSQSVVPDFDGDCIFIDLKDQNFKSLQSTKALLDNELKTNLDNAVAMVLVQAVANVIDELDRMKREEEESSEMSEKKWFRTILYKAEKLHLPLDGSESSITIANEIAGNLMLKQTEEIKAFIKNEYDGTIVDGGID